MSSIRRSSHSSASQKQELTYKMKLFGKNVRVRIRSSQVDSNLATAKVGPAIQAEVDRLLCSAIRVDGSAPLDITKTRLFRNFGDDESYKIGFQRIADRKQLKNIKSVWSLLATGPGHWDESFISSSSDGSGSSMSSSTGRAGSTRKRSKGDANAALRLEQELYEAPFSREALKGIIEQRNELEAVVSRLTDCLATVDGQLAQKNEQMTGLLEIVNRLELELEGATSEKQHLEALYRVEKEKHEEVKVAVKDQGVLIADLDVLIAEEETNQQKLLEQHDEQITELQQEQQKLIEQRDSLRDILKTLTADLDESASKLEQQAATISKLEQQQKATAEELEKSTQKVSELEEAQAGLLQEQERLTLDLQEKQNSLTAANEQVAALESELVKQKTAYQELEGEKQKLEQEHASFKQSLTELETSLQTKDAEHTDLQGQYSALADQLSSLNTQQAHLQSELEAKNKANQEKAAEIDALQAKINEGNSRADDLEARIQVLNTAHEQDIALLNHALAELTAIRSDADQRGCEIEQQRHNIVELEDSLRAFCQGQQEPDLALANEIEQLEADHNQQVAELNREIERQRAHLQKLETDLGEKSQVVQIKENECKALQEQISTQQTQIVALQQENEAFQNAQAGLEAKLAKRVQELDKSTQRVNALEGQITDLLQQLATTEDKQQQAEEGLQESENSLKSAREHIEAVKSQTATLEAELQEKGQLLETSQKEVEESNKKLAESNAALQKLREETQTESQQYEERLQELEQALAVVQFEKEAALHDVQVKTGELEELKAKITLLTAENTSLQAEHSELKKQVKDQVSRADALESEMREHQQVQEKNDAEIARLQEEIRANQLNLDQKTQTLEVLQKQLKEKEEQQSSIEGNLGDLKRQLQEKEERTSELAQRITDLTSEHEQQQADLNARLEEQQKNAQIWSERLQALELEKAALQSQHDAVLKTIEQKEAQIRKYEQQILAHSADLIESTEKRGALQSQVDRLQKQIEDHEACKAELEAKVADQNAAVEKKQLRVIDLEQLQSEVRTQLAEVEAQYAELRRANTAIIVSRYKLVSAKEALDAEVARLTAALSVQQESLAAKEQELAYLEAALTEAQEQHTSTKEELTAQQDLNQDLQVRLDTAGVELQRMSQQKKVFEEKAEEHIKQLESLKADLGHLQEEQARSRSLWSSELQSANTELTQLQADYSCRIAAAEKAVAEQEGLVRDHKDKQTKLESDLQTKLAEILDLQKAQESSQQRIGELEKLLDEHSTTNTALSVEVERLRTDKDVLDKACEELVKELQESQSSIATKDAELKRLTDELGSANRKLEGVNAEKRALEESIAEKEQQITLLENELDVSRKELAERTEALAALDSRYQQKVQDLETAAKDLESAKQAHVVEQRQLQSVNDQLSTELEVHRTALADLRNKIAEKENELTDRTAEINSMRQQLGDQDSCITALQTTMQATQAENEQQRGRIEKLEDEKQSIQQRVTQLTNEIEQHEDTEHKLGQQLEQLTLNLAGKQKQVEQLEEKQLEVQDTLVKTEAQFNKVNAEKNELVDQLAAIESERDALARELASLQEELAQQQDSLAAKEQELTQLQAELGSALEQQKSTKEELTAQQRSNQDLQAQLETAGAELQCMSQKKAESDAAVAASMNQLVELRKALDTLQAEHAGISSEYSTELAGFSSEFANLRDHYSQQTESLQKEVARQEAFVRQLQDAQSVLDKDLQTKRAEIDKLQITQASSEQRIKELEELQGKQLKENAGLSEELKVLQQGKQELEQALATLQVSLQSAESSSAEKEDELQGTLKRLEEANKTKSDLEQQNTTLQAANEELGRNRADLEASIKQQEGTINELTAELNNTRETIKEQQTLLSNQLEEIDGLKAKVDQLITDKTQLDGSIAAITQSLQQAQEYEKRRAFIAEQQKQWEGALAANLDTIKLLHELMNCSVQELEAMASEFEQLQGDPDWAEDQEGLDKYTELFAAGRKRFEDAVPQAEEGLRTSLRAIKLRLDSLKKSIQLPLNQRLEALEHAFADVPCDLPEVPSLDEMQGILASMKGALQKIKSDGITKQVEDIKNGRIAPWVYALCDAQKRERLLEALRKVEDTDEQTSLRVWLARAVLGDKEQPLAQAIPHFEKAGDHAEIAKAIMRCCADDPSVELAVQRKAKQDVLKRYPAEALVAQYSASGSSEPSCSLNSDQELLDRFKKKVEEYKDPITCYYLGVNNCIEEAKQLAAILQERTDVLSTDPWLTAINAAGNKEGSPRKNPATVIKQAVEDCFKQALYEWQPTVDVHAELGVELSDTDEYLSQWDDAVAAVKQQIYTVYGVYIDQDDVVALMELVRDHAEKEEAKQLIESHLNHDPILNSLWSAIHYQNNGYKKKATTQSVHGLYNMAKSSGSQPVVASEEAPLHVALKEAYAISKRLGLASGSLYQEQVDVLLDALEKVSKGQDVHVYQDNGWGKTTAFTFYALLAEKRIHWLAPNSPLLNNEFIHVELVRDWEKKVTVGDDKEFVVVDEAHLAVPGSFAVTRCNGNSIPTIYMTATPLMSKKLEQFNKKEAETTITCFEKAVENQLEELERLKKHDPTRDAREFMWGLYGKQAASFIEPSSNSKGETDDQEKRALETIHAAMDRFPEEYPKTIRYSPVAKHELQGYPAIGRAAGALLSRCIRPDPKKRKSTDVAASSQQPQATEVTEACATLVALSDLLDQVKQDPLKTRQRRIEYKANDFCEAVFSNLSKEYQQRSTKFEIKHREQVKSQQTLVQRLTAALERNKRLNGNRVDDDPDIERLKQRVTVVTVESVQWSNNSIIAKIQERVGKVTQVIYPDLKLWKLHAETWSRKLEGYALVWKDADGQQSIGDEKSADRVILLYDKYNMQGGDFGQWSDASQEPGLSQVIVDQENRLTFSDLKQIRGRIRNATDSNPSYLLTTQSEEEFWDQVTKNHNKQADAYAADVLDKKLKEYREMAKQSASQCEKQVEIDIAEQMITVLEELLYHADNGASSSFAS